MKEAYHESMIRFLTEYIEVFLSFEYDFSHVFW